MNSGDYNPEKEPDATSGRLSILSEHSEEEYQRTIQSHHAQQDLLQELNKLRQNKVSVVNEEVSGFSVDAATTPNEESQDGK